jgi:hypothetical protein
VRDRSVAGRRARDQREQRGLGVGQRGGRLAEVQLRGGLEAVGAAAEVRAVHPLLEDRALVDRALDPQREQRLACPSSVQRRGRGEYFRAREAV